MTAIEEDKRKHLEFIQGVINRHNSNSFTIKGWTITISAALYALAGTIKEPSIVLISIAPIVIFWGLDAFYLSNERCFVDLYNAVANGSFVLPKKETYKKYFDKTLFDNETGEISNFNMNFKKFEIWKNNSWVAVLKLKTILGFYLSLVVISLIIASLLYVFTVSETKIIEVDANLKSSQIELKVKTEPPIIINNFYSNENSVDTVSKE
ncbi:hypothetical protein [Psychroflexus sp. MES1-P1E]|uniref:hypothetical protein n=1 Tax=Psychroflexus sp. MES1-P1E TaxID=2058320 RepID=UPI000C7D94B7|nr:hypothetical protein [Psychroflexus sp. MES1-P1E]PKG44176.1 hypothetical protein CXF67_01100 [Psychroflexus sp. MES1-P1E]